jgi:hypothetical protein
LRHNPRAAQKADTMNSISITPEDRHKSAGVTPGITWRKAPALHVSALTGVKRLSGTLHLRRAGPPVGGA